MNRARVSPRWENPNTVAGFLSGRPNQVLVDHARTALAGVSRPRVLDLGCGAARNALPLAELGSRVVGVDLSAPMLEAAQARTRETAVAERLGWVRAPMAPLPFADRSFDLIVAHGIWNLATSDAGLRLALAEAARVARAGASLFVFTFSRESLPETATPIAGQRLIFDQFAGEPQCFLSEQDLLTELGQVGFVRETDPPLTAYNRADGTRLRTAGPVIWEGVFVLRA